MEKFNRAVRRHHTERLKKARKTYWGYNRPLTQTESRHIRVSDGRYFFVEHILNSQRGFMEMSPKQLGTVVNTRVMCSGACCGNGRKYSGMTLGEIRFHIGADEQMSET